MTTAEKIRQLLEAMREEGVQDEIIDALEDIGLEIVIAEEGDVTRAYQMWVDAYFGAKNGE